MAKAPKTLRQRARKWIVKTARTPRFERIYIIVATSLLGLTTMYWAVIGAVIQSSNADQLANTLLLENGATISGATLPSQHTFLLKIPFFWIVSIFGNTALAFVIVTVLLSLATVAGIAFILYKLDRRPLVFGTLLLGLATVLLFVPAQSYPGSLLPVNFAMLTTRNIEYVLFVGALIMFLKSRRFRSTSFITGSIASIILFASDKLFVSLGSATAILLVIFFAILKRREPLTISLRLLVGIIIGYVGATAVTLLLQAVGVHFDSGSGLGPYGFVQSPKDAVIAVIYGVLSILTNLGANPAYDATVITSIPAHIVSGVVSPAGLGYVATIALFILIVRAVLFTFRSTMRQPRNRRRQPETWQSLLPLALFATTIGAFGVFVISNHYYPADARYLGISLFAGFVILASALSTRKFKPHNLVYFGVFGVVAIIFGVLFQLQNLHAQNAVLAETNSRNSIVAQTLKAHPVDTLVGDYWRVLPIRLDSPTLSATPLQNCTDPRQVLSSRAWQPDLHTASFAYLLQLDGSVADSPRCSLTQVTAAFGRPDSSVVIAGTRANPKEVLLYYDNGIHFLKTATPADASATVKPLSIDSIPFTTCNDQTLMQFVAHEDDDILFMNPDLTHAIKNGDCVRSVFFTAGDAGGDSLYWLGRQHGAEAAYNTILGTPNLPWTERIVALDSTHIVTIANPRGNPKVSLIFMHLPDGSPFGTGFAREHYQSLRKLYIRQISAIQPVDSSGSYSYGDLASSLAHLMSVYKPTEIHTQSTFSGDHTKDHSDHNAVGEFTTLGYDTYKQTHPDTSLTYYLGYPVHDLPENVSGDDLAQKSATFLSFGQFDSATCMTIAACDATVYGIYIHRQYTNPF